MSARVIDGRAAADKLLQSLAERVQELDPHLVVVQVGDDHASASYIAQKVKSAKAIGMRSTHKHLSATTTEKELLNVIDALNADDDVTGFIVQLPLPEHLSGIARSVIERIDPRKDVDGFTAINLGKMFQGTDTELLPPATPAGIIALLEYEELDFVGLHAVVIGRSNTVGKPLATMLLNRSATVTVCHSRTLDLPSLTRQADLLVAAVGIPQFVTADMVKPGAIVVDVGIHKSEGGLCGDVDFASVSQIATAITPVPGGVGPMTVAGLLRNCVRAKEIQLSLSKQAKSR